MQSACGDGLSAAAAQRQQLLEALASLLPPQGAEAHRGGILARRHFERLPDRVLSQVGFGQVLRWWECCRKFRLEGTVGC